MKIANVFAGILGAVGTVLLVGSIALCLFSLDAPVRMAEAPAGAVECADALQEAIAAGDFAAAGNCLYGKPDLGMEGSIENAMALAVWNKFADTLSFSYQGDCYAMDSGIVRDASVTYLEISSVTENLQTRARALLTQKVEAAADMAELYDDSGEFREELVDQVLQEALDQACAEDARMTTKEMRLELICRDGQWWVVPDPALLTALSGGLK